MSPTADELSQQTGRPLRTGDVLTKLKDPYNLDTNDFEVVDPEVMGSRKRFGFFGPGVRRKCVKVRKLTQHGPVSETTLVPRDEDMWSGIVREEERTDRPSLKER